MATVAQRIIIPSAPGIFRTIFLYTGQGDATLMVIPNGYEYLYVLLDSDKDKELNEVNLVKMFKDLLGEGQKLNVFINTHPHNDHIGGINEVYDEIGIIEVWHSNHKPGGKHKDKYEELKYVIDAVGKENVFHLKGTNTNDQVEDINGNSVNKKLGDVEFIVLSPATYLCEEIDEAHPDERDRRIHEQCGVIKFTYGQEAKSILMTGDSDKCAWKDHIMYHKDKLSATLLHASHHGSDTFFKDGDEEAYKEHIDAIAPDYVIVSAPKKEKSPYGHPDDEAMKIYREYVGKKNVCHLGEKPCCVIVDIDMNGGLSIREDFDLIDAYKDDGDDNNGDKNVAKAFSIRTGVSEPRKDELFA